MTAALALSAACAAPASPHGRPYSQPDGSKTPDLFVKGDQHYNWIADENGYTVMQDAGGWWCYATKIDGELVSSGMRVGYGNPKKLLGIVPELKTDPEKRAIDYLLTHDGVEKDHRDLMTIPESALCNFEGTKESRCRLQCLCLLVRFADHANRILPEPEEYDVLFNHNGPTSNGIAPTGSVADVFMANSYDTFVLETTVTKWQNVPYTEEQTVGGNKGLNTYDTRVTWNHAMWMYGT